MNAPPATGALLREVFRLEGQRTLGLARLGRVPGAEGQLTTVDASLGAALEALEARGVAYPGHAVAQRYGFTQADYLLLQLAIARFHGAEHVKALTDALDDADDTVRLSHAIRLLEPGADSWSHAATQLRGLVAVTQGCVVFSAGGDDPEIWLGQAVAELMGLS